jgi:ABC-type uncharacterized transport system fused permease/ATPase subunit
MLYRVCVLNYRRTMRRVSDERWMIEGSCCCMIALPLVILARVFEHGMRLTKAVEGTA